MVREGEKRKMPSDANTDKQNDNSQKKSEANKKFKIRKKCILSCGIIFLLIAISIYAAAYFFHPVDSLEIRLSIFVFVVLAAMSIWFYSAMRIDTNWLSFVSSTIGFFGLFLAITFYPDQEFQRNLNIISFVGMVATLFFLLLYAFINASFFPSKNPDIRQSVDFVSNHFAVEVLFSTLIIGTLFGTIAFLYFNPDKDNSTFFGGIDIKNVALATAGLVTFFWAAKATKNKSIELEEKKQDGKRHDNEIKMAKRRDTAQLIAEASKLLSSENDTQKYAGLSFLNAVASDPEGPLGKVAFDLIADFILGSSNITTANKPRLRAIEYLNERLRTDCHAYGVDELIELSPSSQAETNVDYHYPQLNMLYKGFNFSPVDGFLSYDALNVSQKADHGLIVYDSCMFVGFSGQLDISMVGFMIAENCYFQYCKIGFVKRYKTEELTIRFDKKELGLILQNNKFERCDFSDSFGWIELKPFRNPKQRGERLPLENEFIKCFYYTNFEPNGLNKDEDSNLLIEIKSERQFYKIVGGSEFMYYSPPQKNKRKQSRAHKDN